MKILSSLLFIGILFSLLGFLMILLAESFLIYSMFINFFSFPLFFRDVCLVLPMLSPIFGDHLVILLEQARIHDEHYIS